MERGFNQGDLSVVDEHCAVDGVDHQEPPGTDYRQHLKAVIGEMRAAFPDLHFEIHQMMSEGDTVAFRIHDDGNADPSATEFRRRVPLIRASQMSAAVAHVSLRARPAVDDGNAPDGKRDLVRLPLSGDLRCSASASAQLAWLSQRTLPSALDIPLRRLRCDGVTAW